MENLFQPGLSETSSKSDLFIKMRTSQRFIRLPVQSWLTILLIDFSFFLFLADGNPWLGDQCKYNIQT